MHSDGFRMFASFWWLIFPVFGMLTGLINMWQRHSRANRTIDIIKSYADQGKEPPPELLAALRSPEPMDYRKRGHGWIPVFLFGAMAIAFVVLGINEGGFEQAKGLYFVAIIMVGLCLGFLASTLARSRRDQDRNPPQ